MACTGSVSAVPAKTPHDMAKQNAGKKSVPASRPQAVSKNKGDRKSDDANTKGNLASKQRTTPLGAPVNPALGLIMEILKEASKGGSFKT